MSFFNAMNVSATGLTAQRLRMDVISENIANVNTTRTQEGGPFQRKHVLFQEITETPFTALFRNVFDGEGPHTHRGIGQGYGVRVESIVRDQTEGPMIFDPGHPDADAEGYVRLPNINIVEEMVHMISASRSYEANITALNTTKGMLSRTLDITRQ